VRRVRHRRHALLEPVHGVVPGRARGRGCRRRCAVTAVAQNGGAGGCGRLAADDVGGEPVVAVGVLVGFDEHGVGLAGVDVEVLHHERLHVMAVGLHYRHFVALNESMMQAVDQLPDVQVKKKNWHRWMRGQLTI